MKYLRHPLKLAALSFVLFMSSFAISQDRREIGNLIMEDIPIIPDDIKERISQYQNTRSASFADWIPDDKGILKGQSQTFQVGPISICHWVRKQTLDASGQPTTMDPASAIGEGSYNTAAMGPAAVTLGV